MRKTFLIRSILYHADGMAAWWLSEHFELHQDQCYNLDCRPFSGQRSAKAERLVDFCLGEFKDRPIVPCSDDFYYFQKSDLIRCPSRIRVVLTLQGHDS